MVRVTISGTHPGSTGGVDLYSWSRFRAMRAGTCSFKLNYFLNNNYRPGCYSYWRRLATRFAAGLRNRSGRQVSRVEFTQNQHGVTKNLRVPSNGDYAFNTKFFFDNGRPYGTAGVGNTCYEMYHYPFFNATITFRPYTG